MGGWFYFKVNKLLFFYCIRYLVLEGVKDKILLDFNFVIFVVEMCMFKSVIFNFW